jgi:uncharacterized protein YjbI with pentapeptide repeats
VPAPDPADFDRRLREISEGGAAEFKHMQLSAERVMDIVNATRGPDETSVLVDAAFDGSVFESPAAFSRLRFQGDASFSGAIFKGEARFNGCEFRGNGDFKDATFSGAVTFGGTEFRGGAWFPGTTFEADAVFNGARVHGHTVFDGSTFGRSTLFMRGDFRGPVSYNFETTFEGAVRFDETKWSDGVSFSEARFGGETSFFGAAFMGDCSFAKAIFGRACNFAATKFECKSLILDDVAFPGRLAIVGSAEHFSCRQTRFLDGANIRLDGAVADLTETEFTRPSAISGRDLRVLSMRDAFVRDLTLGGVDLTQCRFVGALSLDELSVGDSTFANSPAGWRWSARDVIFEECLWRVYSQNRAEWRGAAADLDGPMAPSDLPDARQIAVVYRALRKGKEDSKDEPGAAGFYYGEMEMRRFASGPRSTGVAGGLSFWAERGILWSYWLVSGYALRAARALIALLITLVACGALLYWFGFSPRPSFSQATLLSAESSSSLLRPLQTPAYTLTSGGEVVDIALRLLGPLFLGLFLLSLRGRVKR